MSTFEPGAVAERHSIHRDGPAVDFFQGALLGNGGLGAVVTTLPDAVQIHLGHNSVWDIRIAEDNQDQLSTFDEVFDKVRAIPETLEKATDDPWYARHMEVATRNYAKPYPRPFPCGTLVLGFDPRDAEVLGHHVRIDRGTCEIDLLVAGGTRVTLDVFVDMTSDRVWLRLRDAEGRLVPSPFNRIKLVPDPDTPKDIPSYEPAAAPPADRLAFRQVLPALEPQHYDPERGDPRDRGFHVAVRTNSELAPYARMNLWTSRPAPAHLLEWAIADRSSFVACLQLTHGPASDVTHDAAPPLPAATTDQFRTASTRSNGNWQSYWARSGVALGDDALERLWYRNLYFLHCSLREGVTCPGLFGNWSYRNIGTAWHGDYHMNYNTQQPFWVTFSSNHVEKNLPYADLVDHLLPVSRKWAREYYGLRGAYFPHSAYPVPMTTLPYPTTDWGWEICETPWTVQGLWWHYLYTMDETFLRERAFGPIRDAVLFLVDYMRRPECRGPQWGDDAYHVFPTVAPELYAIVPGLHKNYDCLVDLTLIKFVFRAYLRACEVLGVSETEAETRRSVQDVLDHFPAYPTAESARGRVYVSVPGEDPEIVYNTPNSLMTVFPGEEHGLHSSPEELTLLANTLANHRNEGGNELVFRSLQAARLSRLDLEKFKRQVAYCTLPNGTCTDMVLQIHGRYSEGTPYDFMARMGVWIENFALPAVVNECLMQSYTGTIRLFPNWPTDVRAEFHQLRAVGAFLVSALFDRGEVQWVRVVSERGQPLRLILPWPAGASIDIAGRLSQAEGPTLELPTKPGDVVLIRRRS
jgi:hypothetical protein